ncbi:MAG: tetratricopeptide repeat protein [Myxococcota bacterium]|nr:tetratricopeptide repeat protein [Myxococcota bacterium]MEE2779223.1 tetratricopeptide repeat protein [Myxococcota bacterium]
MRRSLATTAILAALACGCVDHQKLLLEELEGEGLTEVTLTPEEGNDSKFAVTATKGEIPCKGTVTITSMPGSSSPEFLKEVVCKRPEPPKKETKKEDPFAKDREACDGGDLKACASLGLALTDAPPGIRDLEEARAIHKKTCDAGGLPSCAHLGLMHLRGLGGDPDEPKAESLFTKTCDGGEMLGCAHLGRLRYINRESKEARVLLKKACHGGNMVGCEWLGTAWREGLGGDQDFKKAKRLYETACESGELSACTSIGVMYMKGEGGVRSDTRAIEMFEAACEAGFQVACEYKARLQR